MPLKKMVACLTTGLLTSFGATAENYRWDAQAGRWSALADWLSITRDSGWHVMDDFTTPAAATVPEPGTQLMLRTGPLALVGGRRTSAR